jgi:conjugal transfer pilus assembly protein TraE
MSAKSLIKEQNEIHTLKQTQKTMLLISMVLNILLVVVFLSKKNTHRETFIPPNATQAFWVEHGATDPNYLEAMAQYSVMLTQNITPENIGINNRLIRQLLRSSQYASFEKQAQLNERKVKEDRISQYFSVSDSTVDVKNLKVEFKGRSQTWLYGKLASEKEITLSISFERDDQGKLWLVSIEPKEDKK